MFDYFPIIVASFDRIIMVLSSVKSMAFNTLPIEEFSLIVSM